MSTRRLAAPVLAFLLIASAARAAPIFSQNAHNNAFPSEREFGVFVADDFSIAANDTARSVSWLGAYAFDGTAPPADDFEIRFLADAAGSPGALLQTFGVGNAVARTAVGTVAGFTEYRYTADLGAGFGITAGTLYWLVIANETTGDDDNWYWSVQSPGGGNVHLSVDDGASWFLTDREAAANFTLDNAAVVPEPASILLMGAGGAAAVARRRRGGGAAKAARGRDPSFP